MYCIETRSLSYKIGKDKILEDIGLQVPEGSIYGFLGPNGAGKTTTLRLVLGLLEKQDGVILINGKHLAEERTDILRSIGSLIEAPSIYAHLTAAENLRIWQKVYRCPESRIAEVLETVGLPDTGRKKAGRFSLGMKQRLAIAVALLHKPSLLILDEPTNGLDPNGIIEIRQLLKKLNQEHGTTILISSHLLAEIEKLVTHLGIIHKGGMLFQGTLEELNQRQAQQSVTRIHAGDPAKALEIAAASGFSPVSDRQHILIPTSDKKAIAQLARQLVQQNIDLYQITTEADGLESIFIDLVKH